MFRRIVKRSTFGMPPSLYGEIPAAAVSMENVALRYSLDTQPVLNGFSLNIKAGEFVSIVGHSGAGKTTALRVIAGLEKINGGYVRIGGRLMGSSFVNVAPDLRRVALVFQDYALFPHLTVTQNIEFGLRRADKRKRREKTMRMVELAGLEGFEKRYPHELSGGQQQRVALARALAYEPVAVLMDEPFSNLNRSLREMLRREVHRIVKSTGVTTVLVTHDGEEALAMSDKVAAMGQGVVDQCGTPEDVYQMPASPEVAKLLGPCELVTGMVDKDMVITEVGKFTIASSSKMRRHNGHVTALLRASELELHPPSLESEGRVLFREFRGEFTEFGVVFPSGVVVRVRRRSSSPFVVGDRVKIGQRENSAIIVFPPQQAP